MLKKLCVLAGVMAAVSATAVGCISDHTYGCETQTVVAAGSSEGEIYTYHGCPDQIIEIGNPIGPNIKHWNKYLVVYRIAEGHKILSTLFQNDAFSNIAYLVENGKVVNGGYVPEGHGETILMALDGAMHNRVRAGYGGDYGWSGSYGQQGRRGGGMMGQNAREFGN
ncbi:MAG: hypothetical protein D6731_13515 [Planctomycetota bacterium]|nr:MAG: hypothetical protein D6731_13515 [Planctomycetota bacterium]